MLFTYQALDKNGSPLSGSIDAVTIDVAIASLQRRGLTLSSITPAGVRSLLEKNLSVFDRVKTKDVVLLSRQISTLFQAQVSALRVFRLLGGEAENTALRRILIGIADDLQGGTSIGKSLAKYPQAFTPFYVSMVRAGEESGKLDETFEFLADYLESTYEVTQKAKNALVYPIFVIITFVGVMVLMLTTVIPNLSAILKESGQEIPAYTKVVLAVSSALVNYGLWVLIAAIVAGFFVWRHSRTPAGQVVFGRFKLAIPYVGALYTKLYLSRIADTLHTMLLSAIPIVSALEMTESVVGNAVYEQVLRDSVESIKGGQSISDSLGRHKEIPGIMTQMIKVGEESGELGNILKTMARFYRREVGNAVDTLVGLIEPVMIVLLGLGVGFLLASVLIPIYNIAGSQ